jgi:PAS domain S-box-containing protein
MTRARDATPDTPPAREGFLEPRLAEDGSDRVPELERRYREIIDRLPAVLYVDGLDEDGLLIDVSPSVTSLLGISREEFLSRPYAWVDTIHPADLERVLAESDRAIATGEPFRTEYRVLHPDGHIVWVREEAVLILDDDGRARHWLGLMLDVTELMTAQAELRETRTKYGALVEQIPAIVYVDVADEHMSTTYVSPQIEEILGYSAQEYIEDPQLWERILHPDDRQEAMATYLRDEDPADRSCSSTVSSLVTAERCGSATAPSS